MDALKAGGWGLISAWSLVIGAQLGTWKLPSKKIRAILMAYGGGALFQALSIELFGQIVESQTEHGSIVTWTAIITAIFGGIFFSLLDKLLNNRGGFIRKASSLKTAVQSLRFKAHSKLLARLHMVPTMTKLTARDLGAMQHFSEIWRIGEIVYSEEEEHPALYLVLAGQVNVRVKSGADMENVEEYTVGKDMIFGDLGLIIGVAYPSDAIVTGAHTRLLKLRLPSVSKRKPRKSILTHPDEKADETGTQSKYAPTLSPSDHVHSIHVGTREGKPPEVMGGDMEIRPRSSPRVAQVVPHATFADVSVISANSTAVRSKPSGATKMQGFPTLAQFGWKAAKETQRLSTLTPFSTRRESPAHRSPNGKIPPFQRRKSIADLLGLHPEEEELNMIDEELEDRLNSPESSGKQAAIMIWLGILIDAVPESLVLGIIANSGNMTGLITFVVGVFLANFPEALSSSGTMLACGIRRRTIMLMWSAIWLWTGLGALLGALIFPQTDQETREREVAVSAIEGLAGGAMLTMIANSVLPEAFEQGGDVVGLSCLLGFLSALAVKSIGKDLEGTTSSACR